METDMVGDNFDEVNHQRSNDDIHDVESTISKLICFDEVNEIPTLSHLINELVKKRHLYEVSLLCVVVHSLYLLEAMPSFPLRSISDNSFELESRRQQLMKHLVETEKCRDIIRMGPQTFMQLCNRIRLTGMVKDSPRATVEEQVAKFLHIVGHNVKNCIVHQSGEIVNQHFHNVLGAVISLKGDYLVQPTGSDVPLEILNNQRFYPYFKDCIGAIDGTHIRVKVSEKDASRFCGRKYYPTQNVFAACDFDMKFTYVLSGWEGRASDSRILKNALSREDCLKIPQGKFYLGDADFKLKRGILTPFRGIRYHLKEYSGRGPENYKELFNLRHASLRNVIERTFGLLKKRFPIIGEMTEPYYSFPIMSDIVIACCILHNYLMGVDVDEHLIAEVERELEYADFDHTSTQAQQEDYQEGCNLRELIANEMWNEYIL